MNHPKEVTRTQLIVSLLDKWQTYSKNYRELIPEYESLMMTKRELGLPLRKVRVAAFEDIEKIDFFDITDESEAEAYLATLDTYRLLYLNYTIDTVISSYGYRTIRTSIVDSRSAIKRKLDCGKGHLGCYDPNYSGPTGAGKKIPRLISNR